MLVHEDWTLRSENLHGQMLSIGSGSRAEGGTMAVAVAGALVYGSAGDATVGTCEPAGDISWWRGQCCEHSEESTEESPSGFW